MALLTPQPNDPDGPLVLAALEGDINAFGTLVGRLQGRVYGFILRHVKNPNDAEDLTQDTLLETHRKLANFQGNSKFSTWVLGIALNIARNYRRRTPQYRYPHVGDDEIPETPDMKSDPYRETENKAFAQSLQEAINTLPEDVREALVMVSLEGMGYQEAAEVVGIPTGTMKTRVFRARKMLREHLKKHDKEEFIE
ncbi:MAG: RNA polymerase sigma factor [Rhodospirillales bacterium]|nr:RNA polymerase sigma factor [Rhodospirillales bacterium]